jgi:TonB family protein
MPGMRLNRAHMHSAILKTVLGVAIAAGLTGMVAWCATQTHDRSQLNLGLARSEQALRRVAMHIAEFSPLAAPLARASCADVRPPEAIATPDPLLQLDDSHVRVSFIIDSAGRVQSPFILEGAGPVDDLVVLRAVRYWRFRPALCNGVPTEMEARVRFAEQ